MSKATMSGSGNVVRMPKRASTKKASEEKWGKSVMRLGFCMVPSLLLRGQARLGLTPTQLAIVMQLCDFWWDNERKPYPSKKALAERLCISPRQIQRHLAELEKAGLIRRLERRNRAGAKVSNTYDLSGLVKKLKELEPEFRQAEEKAKAERRAVSQRGHGLRTSVKRPGRKN